MFEVRKPACTHLIDFSEGEGRLCVRDYPTFLHIHACFSYLRKAGFFILVFCEDTKCLHIIYKLIVEEKEK